MYADAISRFPNSSSNNDFKPLDIDDLMYEVSVINTFVFDPQNMSSFNFEENTNINEVKPYINLQILLQSKMQMRKLRK